MGPDLDVVTLRLLVAIEELGSLRAAGARLDISQPAASARVREFEARWRLSVVERTARGSSLTTDGQAVVTWARLVLHSLDGMRTSLTALGSERRSGLSVAASLTIAEFVLPRWLGELHARHPDLHPRLHVVNSAAVAQLVHDGHADVGFIETAERPVDLETRVIGWDRLAVVVDPAHPWARRQTAVPRSVLAEAAWVLREEGSGTRATFERALRREVASALEASSTTALIGAARAGVGPAVVSARAVTSEVETGRLVVVPVDLDLMRPLTAVWRQGTRMPENARDLLAVAAASGRE